MRTGEVEAGVRYAAPTPLPEQTQLFGTIFGTIGGFLLQHINLLAK